MSVAKAMFTKEKNVSFQFGMKTTDVILLGKS